MILHNLRTAAAATIITSLSVLSFGQTPRRDFRTADFEHLRWIDGTWVGTTTSGANFYERYRFLNDSTIEMQSFSDRTLRKVSEHATLALRSGRIFNESGRNRWEAARVNNGIAQFVPVRGATNAFQYTRMSRNRWTATIIPANNGRRTVYEMRSM